MTEQAIRVAVSTVIFALRSDPRGRPALSLPLVRRIREPHLGRWALPGGPLAADLDLETAAADTLLSTTGLAPRYLEQLYAFGGVDRSPDGRVVSIVYWALVSTTEAAGAADDENVAWFDADDLPVLAFDHNLIVEYALWRLRTKLEYSHIAHAFLGERFTLAELRGVHEAILRRKLDPANFRRTIESSGGVVPTEERRTGTRHRPPRLYRYDTSTDYADRGPLPPRSPIPTRREA